MFRLHPRLAQDGFPLGRFPLCRLLLMNERRYPWFILVPERTGIGEIHHLEEADQFRLIRESCALSRTLSEVFRPDKLNVAALGNRVPQLHVHHVVRYRDDPAWPEPVWGRFAPEPYPDSAVGGIRARLRKAGLPDFAFFEAEP
jgi:diadenosine tetraphosphate (Ap4A) HIT family hydrolase